MSQQYHGAGGAPGVAIGQVYRYSPDEPLVGHPEEDADAALERFAAAQRSAAQRLFVLEEQLRAEGRMDEAAILNTQVLFVEDMALTDEVTRRIRDHNLPLEEAFEQAIQQLRASFEALDDAYLRERASDIDAVGRILRATLQGSESSLRHLPPDAVVVATDLTPAETAELRGGTIAGFATAQGGPTGHTAILARSLGIPAVVGLGEDVLALEPAAEVILDGDNALLIASPTVAEYTRAEQRISEQQAAHLRQQSLQAQPGQLADGHPVALWANIGHPDEAAAALQQGAEGIGLFRTEFLFLDRAAPPDEDEQYVAYRRVLETMQGRTVVVRTLDIGGDKPLPYLALPPEPNPFLGVRGLRLCMQQVDLFQSQLRALLRAALHGDLWVMLPMIATPDDLAWGQAQVQAAAAALEQAGIAHRYPVPLGVMIETPAAAVTADLLAREAAFFSIGSNDLTQYAMAADRGNAALTTRYAHSATAVLRLIAQTTSAAQQAGIPVGVCGELAGVPGVAPVLAGLGVAELSMAPAALPAVKEALLALTLPEARQAALQATAGGQPAHSDHT